MSEKHIDMTKRLQKIGQMVNEYKDVLTSRFKDMNVDVKERNFYPLTSLEVIHDKIPNGFMTSHDFDDLFCNFG
jgi:hypothetical protein